MSVSEREKFRDPAAEFRLLPGYGGPWRQEGLAKYQSLGFGGVVYHQGTHGYLTDPAQWQEFEALLKEAEARGMFVWIYDEDGFPSGPAGGQVLAGYPEGEAVGLYYSFAFIERANRARLELPWGKPAYLKAAPICQGRLELDNAIDVSRFVKGEVLEWGPHDQCIDWGTPDRGRWLVMAFSERVLYERTFAASAYLKPPYRMINLMDEKAVAEFLRLTHERYYQHGAGYFGGVVPAFFTDEPLLLHYQDKEMPTSAIPWHPQFTNWFQEKYGYDIMQWLPALYHNCGPRTKKVRCDYYRLAAERTERAYHKQIADWCQAHNVASSGHLLLEERLYWHVLFQGDYMRCLRHMQRPGIDVLSSKPELTRPHENLMGGALLLGAKFCSSVKHQFRRERTMSETSGYQQGMRGLAVSFEEVRGTLSWQYALGIDTIISFYSPGMLSEEQWRELNAYAGRLGMMLTGGRHVCDLAVFYPIQSQWANFVRAENELAGEDRALQQQLDAEYVELSMALLEGQRDFDYLHQEELLKAKIEGGKLLVADESYRALLLPPMDTEEAAIYDKAIAFAEAGGVVLAVGRQACHSPDGNNEVVRERLEQLLSLDRSRVRPVEDNGAMLAALEELAPRDFRARPESRKLLYLHRRKEGREVFFIYNNSSEAWAGEVWLAARGEGEVWDPVSGEIAVARVREEKGGTAVAVQFDPYCGKLVVFGAGR